MKPRRVSWLASTPLLALVAGVATTGPALTAQDPWEDYKPIELTCPDQAQPKLVLVSQSTKSIGDRDRVTLTFAAGEILSVSVEVAALDLAFEQIFAGSPNDTDAVVAGNAKRTIDVLGPFLTACSEGGEALLKVRQTLDQNRKLLGLD